MTDLQCRCKGVGLLDFLPALRCRMTATQEDGLCDTCRECGAEFGVVCCEDITRRMLDEAAERLEKEKANGRG